MIAKVSKGKGFRGALNYTLDKEKGAHIIGGNMMGQDARELSREFAEVRELRPEAAAPVAHFTLSLKPGEHLDDRQFASLAHDFADRMGYQDSQYVVIRHHDTAHEHVHIVASRLQADGALVDQAHDYSRGQTVARQLEEKYGLDRIASSWEKGEKARELAPVEVQQIGRDGLTFGDRVRGELGERPFTDARSWEEAEARVSPHGWHLEAYKGGVSVVGSEPGEKVGLSKVERAATPARLAKQYGETYADWRAREAAGIARDAGGERSRGHDLAGAGGPGEGGRAGSGAAGADHSGRAAPGRGGDGRPGGPRDGRAAAGAAGSCRGGAAAGPGSAGHKPGSGVAGAERGTSDGARAPLAGGPDDRSGGVPGGVGGGTLGHTPGAGKLDPIRRDLAALKERHQVEQGRAAAVERLPMREQRLRQLQEIRAEAARLDVRLQEGFRRVYADPIGARGRFDQAAGRDGAAAVRQLRESPQEFGELRGGRRILGGADQERTQALRNVEPVAVIAGEHVRAQPLAATAARAEPGAAAAVQETEKEIRRADEQLRQMEERGAVVVRAGKAITQLEPAERATLRGSELGPQAEEVVGQMKRAVAAVDRAAEGPERGRGRGRGGISF